MSSDVLHSTSATSCSIVLYSTVCLEQWCSNRGPQGPLEWPAKQFSLERKLSTLVNHLREFF